jgi:hypothetical protein
VNLSRRRPLQSSPLRRRLSGKLATSLPASSLSLPRRRGRGPRGAVGDQPLDIRRWIGTAGRLHGCCACGLSCRHPSRRPSPRAQAFDRIRDFAGLAAPSVASLGVALENSGKYDATKKIRAQTRVLMTTASLSSPLYRIPQRLIEPPGVIAKARETTWRDSSPMRCDRRKHPIAGACGAVRSELVQPRPSPSSYG